MIASHESYLANWICTPVSIIIVLTRLLLISYGHLVFDIAEYLSVVGLLVLIARMVNVYYLLRFGTSNDAILENEYNFSPRKSYELKTGSILALAARMLDTTFYWLQISVLLVFYAKLLHSVRWAARAIRVVWVALAASYVAVILATFTECHPFHLYWQIHPNPGQCVRGFVQLFLQWASTIVLDLTVLAISVPLLRLRGRSMSQKLRIGLLVCLGLFCIVITCVRLTFIYRGQSLQPTRSFFASIRFLTSTLVANMPTIFGRVQNVRRRKAEQEARRASRPEVWVSLEFVQEQRDDHPYITGQPQLSTTGSGGKQDVEQHSSVRIQQRCV